MPDNFDIYSWKENLRKLNENTPVSVGLNMDQTDAVYKVLEDNFGEEHIKDMFTLGSLSFYNMMVKGGIAGVFKEGNINEESYTVAGKSITLNKGKKSDGTDWTVTFPNGKETSLSDVLSLIKPFPKGITKENINEDKADASRWFGNLKQYYQKGLTSPDLKDPADKTEYKRLAKDFFSKLEVDNKVRPIGEEIDVLNKIADMFDRKYPHLKFDVNTMFDRIEVRGDDQDVFTFGEELAGQKIFDYEITTIDKEGRNYEVRIVRSDSIVRNAVNPTNEEKPGLWANIRAKQERGEKPARKGSKAYKIAKKAGDEINKEK